MACWVPVRALCAAGVVGGSQHCGGAPRCRLLLCAAVLFAACLLALALFRAWLVWAGPLQPAVFARRLAPVCLLFWFSNPSRLPSPRSGSALLCACSRPFPCSFLASFGTLRAAHTPWGLFLELGFPARQVPALACHSATSHYVPVSFWLFRFMWFVCTAARSILCAINDGAIVGHPAACAVSFAALPQSAVLYWSQCLWTRPSLCKPSSSSSSRFFIIPSSSSSLRMEA